MNAYRRLLPSWRVLAFLLLTLFIALPLSAQRLRNEHGFRQTYPGSLSIGLLGGGNLNLGLNGPMAECDCDYSQGSSFEYHAGIHLDILVNRWFALRLQGLFEDHSTEYQKDVTRDLFLVTGETVPVTLDHRSEISLQYINTSFSAIWFTGPRGLFLLTGVGVGFYLDGTLTEKAYLKTPGYTFPQSGTSVYTYHADEPLEETQTINTRASVLLGIGYDLPVSRGVTIAPELQADIPITSVTTERSDWRIPVFRASFVLRFGL